MSKRLLRRGLKVQKLQYGQLVDTMITEIGGMKALSLDMLQERARVANSKKDNSLYETYRTEKAMHIFHQTGLCSDPLTISTTTRLISFSTSI